MYFLFVFVFVVVFTYFMRIIFGIAGSPFVLRKHIVSIVHAQEPSVMSKVCHYQRVHRTFGVMCRDALLRSITLTFVWNL